MKCSCGSSRIAKVSGKTSDCCVFWYKKMESDGYVPDDVGIGGGDYIEFSYCLDCGKIQGKFPIPEKDVEEVFCEEEE